MNTKCKLNHPIFDLVISEKQKLFLERIFFATRNTYNTLLEQYIPGGAIGAQMQPSEVSLDSILQKLNELRATNVLNCSDILPRSVLINKLSQLSKQLTALLVEKVCLRANLLAFEDRGTPNECVFDGGSFFISLNSVYLPGLEEPLLIKKDINTSLNPKEITIIRYDVGQYKLSIANTI